MKACVWLTRNTGDFTELDRINLEENLQETTMNATAAATTLRRASAAEIGCDPSTLAGEHALLLRDIRRRAAPVLALLQTRSWPYAELGTLTGFLRTAVLRQASEEEAPLYRHGPSAPFAELTAERVRLYTLTEQLDRAEATSCSVTGLRELIDELLDVLEQHLVQEQALLAALPDILDPVPAAADSSPAPKPGCPRATTGPTSAPLQTTHRPAT